MADGIKAGLIGTVELTAAFKGVAQDMQQKTALRMVATAGGVLRKEAKRIATSQGLRRTGAMINNIAIKREKSVPPGTVQYNLGVRHGRDIRGKAAKKLLLKVGKSGRIVRANDPFYWTFLEFDTKKRPGTPFIGPALVNKKAEAIAAMETRLQTALDKAGK